jgi:hypothetical protein
MFPAAWARRHARDRLGIEADEMDGGHYISLSRPRQLAARLDAYVCWPEGSPADAEAGRELK